MNTSTYSKILFILLVLYSCMGTNSNVDITGKWYSYSKKKGYIEYTIDTLEIKAFSHWSGYLGDFKYSFNENYTKSSPIFIKINDKNNIIINSIDTLHRMKDSVLTYQNKFFNSSDSLSVKFYRNFQNRAHLSYIENDYYTQEEYEKSLQDTLNIKEEIIFLRE